MINSQRAAQFWWILKGQFDADAAHLRSKASRGKVTSALATEMKKDVNKIYDHALGR